MQLAFIWDMDGTLVDSYPAIVPAALESLSAQGVSYDREKLYQEVIRTSVGDVLEKLAAEHNLDLLPLRLTSTAGMTAMSLPSAPCPMRRKH